MKRRFLVATGRSAKLKNYFSLREAIALAAVLLALTFFLAWQNGLGRLDWSLYDQALSVQQRPTPPEIVIVAIDDSSLATLGRFPWRRDLHAQLLNKISQDQPLAVGMDIIFSEASPDDTSLAQAMQRSGKVVLPVLLERNIQLNWSVSPPAMPLAQAAAELGHIYVPLDADGVVRKVWLAADLAGTHWQHFAAQVLKTARAVKIAHQNLPNISDTPATPHADVPAHSIVAAPIPFTHGVGHFVQIPYSAVLAGQAPANLFRGKYVLVGATAAGLADSFPTPLAGLGGSMPGVEIHANILASLISGQQFKFASKLSTALFCLLPVLLALLANFFLTPRLALISTALLFASTLLLSFLIFKFSLVWLPPAAALIALLLAYPLWSWRRLETAIRYLGEEFKRLDSEPHLLPEDPLDKPLSLQTTPFLPISDVLDKRIAAVELAATRVRDLRRFVSDSLNSLPDATLVTGLDAQVLLFNPSAQNYFSVTQPNLQNAYMPELLAKFSNAQVVNRVALARFDWWDLMRAGQVEFLRDGVECQDTDGRDFLIKSAPCYSAGNTLIGWIISLFDLSALRASEKSRDETLRFLSHDMRSPQAAILTLIDLQKQADSALPQAEFFSRIEKYAHKTLGLADNFVQLAKAESQEYKLEELELADVLWDACDEMWAIAKEREIELVTDVPEDSFVVQADRHLLARALVNLISNSIKYSPAHTTIRCVIEPYHYWPHPAVMCKIIDQGRGIALADQNKVFRKFQRFEAKGSDGVGLGLVFVKTVVEKHQGEINFVSDVDKGTTFNLIFPLHITEIE